MKKIIALLMLLLLFGIGVNGQTWNNDSTLNDTCLVVESDKPLYRPNAQGEIFVEYRITNNCGKALITNIAEFFEDRQLSLVETIKLEQANTTVGIPI